MGQAGWRRLVRRSFGLMNMLTERNAVSGQTVDLVLTGANPVRHPRIMSAMPGQYHATTKAWVPTGQTYGAGD